MQATIEPYLTTMLNGLEKEMFVKLPALPPEIPPIYTAVNNAAEEIILMNGSRFPFGINDVNFQVITKRKYIKGFLYRILKENGFDVCY